MASSDAVSHASLNGLYVKAQELDRGHASPPPAALAPPGSAGAGQAHASSHASNASASSKASASAHTTASASSKTGVAADYSNEYRFYFDESLHTSTIWFHCFDTPNYVRLHATSKNDGSEQLLVSLKDLCLDLHKLWSFSLAGSDISRANKKVQSVEVDPRTAKLVSTMLSFNAREPLYDFTVGRLSFLWKKAERVPSTSAVEKLLTLTGASKIHVTGTKLTKDDPRIQLDVGGSAKGAAADILAEEIANRGYVSAEINLGGNLYMVGEHPSGRPWKLDIVIPESVPAEPVSVEVTNGSVVTSGNYERFVEIDGKRYQHIIDPRTGWPSESDVVSASVVAASSLEADMLATTACLAGSKGFNALAARHPNVRLIAILSNGTVLDSKER